MTRSSIGEREFEEREVGEREFGEREVGEREFGERDVGEIEFGELEVGKERVETSMAEGRCRVQKEVTERTGL